jgi:putative ABC transport system permease protein
MMRTLLQDLRFGWRMLARNPGFTAIAVITLGLGIGVNTAIFSVVNGVLLHTFAYADPGRLVFMTEHSQQVPDMSVSYLDYLDWQKQNTVFTSLAAVQGANFNLTGVEPPVRLSGWNVSANFFSTLGVKPVLGRDFLTAEDAPNGNPVGIISYSFWQRQFGGDPGIIGKALTLNGRSCTVVGVLPPHFKFYGQSDVFVPIGLEADSPVFKDRGDHPAIVTIARLRPGVTLAEARSQMETIAHRLATQYPKTNSGNSVAAQSLHEFAVGNIQAALLALMAAVGLVLLIACANIANLLLARGAGRNKEIAIRAALGAGRTRIFRQLLAESVLLALLGGAAGLLIGSFGISGLNGLIPAEFQGTVTISLDRWVLGFTLLVSIATGIIFGLAPALRASRTDLNESLKEGGRTSAAASERRLSRNFLAAFEIALALVLLAGAGLVIRSFRRLLQVNPGFATQHVLTMQLDLPQSSYPKDTQIANFYYRLIERVQNLPGVESVGLVTPLPLTAHGWQGDFDIEGQPLPAPGHFPNSDYHTVSPGYFRTIGIPLLRGRLFAESDNHRVPLVAVVSENFARRYWPHEDPIGRRFQLGTGSPWISVIGVVGDTKQYGLTSRTRTEFYLSYLQRPLSYMTVVVRTATSPLALTGEVRRQVSDLDKDVPVFNIRSMDQLLDESVSPQRMTMLLLGIFSALAMLLAAVGIYGVVSYSVSRRTHEIGIRMALGARQGDVLRLVLGEGMKLALIGVGCGIVAALGLTRLMASLLYDVKPTDPFTFVLVSLLLAGVTLLACYIPARRAAKVDPTVALRYE